MPDYDTLTFARGTSLVVVESVATPLRGWAMEVEALNLLTDETTPDTRSEEQREQFERIHFYGNNGWTTGFGKDQANRVLAGLHQQGLLDADVVLGFMLARGHHGTAVERLATIIRKLG